MSLFRKLILSHAAALAALTAGAATLLDNLGDITADKWSIIGKNIIVEGNVVIPHGSYRITCDRAVVNIESRDFETAGNVKIINRRAEKLKISPQGMAEIQRLPDTLVAINNISFSPLGDAALEITAYYVTDTLDAEKVTGNLVSGYFNFENAVCRMGEFAYKTRSGERLATGDMKLKDAEVSSCNYLAGDNAHYSIALTEANIYSHQNDGFDLSQYDYAPYEHSMLGKNALLKIYGLPVFYLPFAYKPKDESPRLFELRMGANSDLGYFISASKRFRISDYPASSVNLMVDYYTKRGVGYGAETEIRTDESKTRIFGYGIYDTDPYGSSEVQLSRFRIPNYRYELTASNVTHLTPSLDFRGYLNFMSDPYFEHDFFKYNYDNNPEPNSYAALEKQFEYFTTSLYTRLQTNDFFTSVQHLPEFRIDVPRQELFGSNIYYQGQHELSYLQMRWRKFDKQRLEPNYLNNANYSSLRLDSVNFLYYPMKFGVINFTPRAGLRMTYYSKTTRRDIDEDDLETLFRADQDTYQRAYDVENYDMSGGGKLRFIGEVGFDLSTKIYRTWENVRSPLLGLDGLRHVMVPYVNYTFIPSPSVNRDNLLYFDDIDRINRQNFFRLGLQNRLQTRRDNQIVNIFTMENYWDFFLQSEDGYSNVGDFCTRLTAQPMRGLAISTLFSLNASGGGPERPGTVRNGSIEPVRPGISGNWLNRWVLSVSYEPVDDFVFNFDYAYQDAYSSRTAYSMGSSLTELESGSIYDKIYSRRTQQLTYGMRFPLTPDRRTKLMYQISYDFEVGTISYQSVALTHQMHCWEIYLALSQSAKWDTYGSKTFSNSISVNARLVGGHPLKRITGRYSDAYKDYAVSNVIGGIL